MSMGSSTLGGKARFQKRKTFAARCRDIRARTPLTIQLHQSGRIPFHGEPRQVNDMHHRPCIADRPEHDEMPSLGVLEKRNRGPVKPNGYYPLSVHGSNLSPHSDVITSQLATSTRGKRLPDPRLWGD